MQKRSRVCFWSMMFALVGGVMILMFSGFRQPLGNVLRRITLPVQYLFAPAQIWMQQTRMFWFSVDLKRFDWLESQLSKHVVDEARISALEQENRSLRAQAKFLVESGYESVGAQVISRDLRGERALLMIDRGARDHVSVGQAVIAEQGVGIGKISRIYEQTSVVELISDPESRLAVTLAATGTLMGVLEGRGNGALSFEYISPMAKIAKNDLVVTSAVEENVPPRLPVGIVNEVYGKPTDPFFSASIEPIVSFSRVTFVSVLRPRERK